MFVFCRFLKLSTRHILAKHKRHASLILKILKRTHHNSNGKNMVWIQLLKRIFKLVYSEEDQCGSYNFAKLPQNPRRFEQIIY